MDYHTVLQEHGRPADTASASERALAIEVAQLRAIIAHGACHHDVATLRNVQAQKNRVVEVAERVADDPSMLVTLFGAVRELRRITGAVTDAA